MNHINTGVAAFARSFGNSEKRLDEWCATFGTFDMREEIISLVKRIEGEICTDIENSNRKYTFGELEILVRNACNARDPRIEKEGIAGILDYVVWICWHEGYLNEVT